MRPWITKKVIEYLGEEEKVLIDYICKKITEHQPPQEIQNQLSFVLDEETEIFVLKMWRLLIFEMLRAQSQ
jgi:RNA-binding protein 25